MGVLCTVLWCFFGSAHISSVEAGYPLQQGGPPNRRPNPCDPNRPAPAAPPALTSDPVHGFPDWRSKTDVCGRRYYWHIDPTTGAMSSSTWTSPRELWQQEQTIVAREQADAKLAAAAAVRDYIDRDTLQEIAYQRKIAYEKEQADTLALEAKSKAAKDAEARDLRP